MRRHSDFNEEIEAHLQLEVDRLIAQGMAPGDAALAARKTFGNVGMAHDRFHDAQPMHWLFDLASDLRHATRTLLRSPGFTAAVVITLALGIGANSAMFTIVNAVLFRPLPYPDPDGLVSISRTIEGIDQGQITDDVFRQLDGGAAPSLRAVAAQSGGSSVVKLGDTPEQLYNVRVTPRYFEVFGIHPLLGRTFSAAEAQPGGADVVVLSEQLWRDRFGADSSIVGRSIIIDERPHAVLGVMPAALSTSHPFWTPLRIGPPVPNTRWHYAVTGRLHEGATAEALRTEIETITQRPEGGQPGSRIVVMTVHERRFGESRLPLMLLWGTVGVLLLIACANIANLSLARATGREREFSLRLALGAGRRRVIRYVLCESAVLAVAGGALGAVLAAASVGWFVRISPGAVRSAQNVRVDALALGFTLTIAMLTAFASGLVPALRAAGGRFQLMGTPRAAGSRRENMLRRVLIVGQLAGALVMLTGAAIVTKTLARVSAIDLGFQTGDMLIVRPVLSRARYDNTRSELFYRDLMARLRQDPAVVSVAMTDVAPLGGIRASMQLDGPDGKPVSMDLVSADARYFTTLGARLIEGRLIGDEDATGSARVTVINESLARQRFSGRSPLGATLEADGQWTVIGVVSDIRQRSLEEAPRATAYLPLAQVGYDPYLTLLVRTVPDAPGLIERVRDMARQIDAGLVAPRIEQMETRMAEAVAPRRFIVVLLGMFAGLAALLAVIGLYSVLSYLVAERTREIGIRVALGADTARVLKLVLGNGIALTGIGVLLGAAAAALTVRLLKSMVYDMSVYDPWMFAASAGMLMAVALVAAWLPARRAAAIEPVKALRVE